MSRYIILAALLSLPAITDKLVDWWPPRAETSYSEADREALDALVMRSLHSHKGKSRPMPVEKQQAAFRELGWAE